MTNNYFSKEDDMRPFIVKKMNLPPSSTNEEPEKAEQAEDDETESYKVHSRNRITQEHVYEIPPHRRKGMLRSAKPLFISILSAITIGVLLGFIVLRISAGGTEADQGMSQTPSTATPAADSAEDEGKTASDNTTSSTLEPLQAYVLQAGVYSEKANTDDAVSMFENQGHSAIVWKENEQFYVITHVFSTEEQAKNAAEGLEESELETYAKPWGTEEQTVDLSEEEATFIQLFVKTWKETVEKHSNHETEFLQSWEQLTEDMPTSDTAVQQLVTYLTDEIKETDVAIDIEKILLDTWFIYAQLAES